ncbi:hypothetical protein M422DRAFT_39752 [Sphaerobolus stellatus SS14]|uniref:Unplaced genomic scaffold SPHSTscaffold_758, whole genome shotgun sequence n=1 Tax=Sphaerobolus stellatus (strain SS14) TaxID=990650 RepID=A0A0C9TMH2_SPHS4|nr:hypothetical protein M422DRAFT_39838 [Sphaerobolus stellatus SS14]KIJ23169.1 hypothetical protein M422DRAFT_39752 [Sphaerobolus stellatus SS14]
MKDGAVRLHHGLLDPVHFATIALASTALLNTLLEYSKGSREKVAMEGAVYKAKYEDLLEELKFFYETRAGNCLALQQSLYTQSMASLEKSRNRDEDEFVI